MVQQIDANIVNKAVQSIEVDVAQASAPATPAPVPANHESLLRMAHAIAVLIAMMALETSRNDRTKAEGDKKMYKHWSKVGVDSTKGQGTAGAWVAVAAFAVTAFSVAGGLVKDKHDQKIWQKAGDLTSGVLSIWTQSHIAAGQEANGKSSLILTDIQSQQQGAEKVRNQIEEPIKNVFQLAGQMQREAAKGA